MRNKFLLAIGCLLTGLVVGQETETDQFDDSGGPKLTFAIRGKALFAPGWEDISWTMYSIGTELIYNNHHCLGFDLGMFRRFQQFDDEMDQPLDEYTEKRNYLLLDYKYHFPINENVGVYLNSYWKFNGKYRWDSHTYISTNNPVEYDEQEARGIFQDVGAGVGMKTYFGWSNFGFDFSLNVGKRIGSYDRYQYDENNVQSVKETVNETRGLVYLRLNFFYHFFRVI